MTPPCGSGLLPLERRNIPDLKRATNQLVSLSTMCACGMEILWVLSFAYFTDNGDVARGRSKVTGAPFTPSLPPPLCEMIYIYIYNYFKTLNLYNSGGEKAQIRRIYMARKISRMVKQNLDVDITLGWRI